MDFQWSFYIPNGGPFTWQTKVTRGKEFDQHKIYTNSCRNKGHEDYGTKFGGLKIEANRGIDVTLATSFTG
jgi:hypothetical protein